ncbi:Flp pilus assembly protein CpaB [Dyella amyloliquefaciens]|uniref:Flp pilus assembly protein CpaB n=1 Tax=Dyella amyloliquefaciens TaxID=1770545 RepID=UPI00102E3551|nr:Flp pilus assembly protein CpaB [Dyella amyloliquefaciens]
MHKASRIAAIVLVAIATLLAMAAFSMGQRSPAATVAASQPAVAAPPSVTAHVMVAGQRLPAGLPIAAASLRDTGVTSAPDDSYAQAAPLVGQVPRVEIAEGTVITSSLLSNPLAMQIQVGERALAVPVDEISGVGARVQPGDYVDVVLTLRSSDTLNLAGVGRDPAQSRVIASRLRVMAFGNRDLPRVGAGRPVSTGTPAAPAEAAPRMAVLATPMSDVDAIVLGVQSGKLSLALRNPGDLDRPESQLFPRPGTVLGPRNDLSAEQRAWLQTPENRAFAGLDERALAGRSLKVASAPKPSAPRSSGLEIIRGATPSREQPALTP